MVFVYKNSPNLLFGMLCLPGDQSHPFAQPTINPLACCICWTGVLGHVVFFLLGMKAQILGLTYCWGMLKNTESIAQTGLSKRRLIELDDRTIWFQALSDSVSKRIGRDLFLLLKWLLFFLLSLSCQFMSTFHIILTALSVLCITKRWGKETTCLVPFTIFIVSIGSIVLSVKSRSMCQGHGTAPSSSFKK